MKIFQSIRQHIHQLLTVYIKEFSLVAHDGGITLFFLFLPLVYPVIYSLIYNPELVREVRMVVVDNDRTAMSRELVRKLDATQEVRSIGYAADLPEARHAMNSHDCFVILEIPSGFERKIGRNETANAVMYCEMSLLLRYKSALVAASNIMMEMGAELQQEKINDIAPLAETVMPTEFMPIRNVAMGNIESGFDSFLMPGIVILILHQCIILAMGMAGGAKREKAALIGYNSVDMQKSLLMTMLGEMLCYMTILFLPILFLMHYVPLIFDFPMENHIIDLLAFLLPMVIACMGLGFCVQGITWERESIFVLWVATSLILLFLSGLTWPRYAITGIWSWLADIAPSTWGVNGFIRMNTNGATISQAGICYRNLWILAGVYMVLGYIVQRFVVRPQMLNAHRGSLVEAAITGK